ncbi:calmodulin mutant syncam9 [Thecamonas trahens ATCC 50062]|uniref:Calmodulin mutant syncam9 n=1 Tax=Thecamonas trahens ATCC 50062 TaxID=461836 RepID=A0A0L0D8X2_THETB|nr:calmodulin mutant syncam9 [Thecamonas trahens ATCC 50062]KNC47738.1 calmodulin mutant syncam9 [Thecamonas trahens ATCC 50062]|eukprot:XP_013759216.1 calmodulin mutant syncam9 [Thecamonas trahens ATCC 50062]
MKRWVRSTLALVLVAWALAVPALADDVECSPEEEERVITNMSDRKRLAVLLILSTLIATTICFELAKDKLEELVEGPMQPILDSMWGELTVLGFLGLMTFIIQRTGWLSRLSCSQFADNSTLPEAVETTHMLIFAVMVMFICEVVLLVLIGKRIMRKWRQLELGTDELSEMEEVAHDWVSHVHSDSNWDCGMYMLSMKSSVREKLEYMLLRAQFVKQHDSCGDDFDFAQYLAIVLGEELGEIVEVQLTTWLALEVLFVCFYFYFALADEAIVGGVIGVAFLLFVFLLFVKAKLNKVHSMLTPKPAPGVSLDSSETDPLVALQNAAQPTFVLQPLKQRSWLGRLILGEPPNKHERLFWLDRHGPRALYVIIQFSLLFIALYIAVMSIYISPVILNLEVETAVKVTLLAAGYVPILLALLWLMPVIIARYVEVCNIEMLKREPIIKDVVRSLKTAKALRAIRMLHVIAFTQVHRERRERSEGAGTLTINGDSPTTHASLSQRSLDGESRVILESIVAHHHLSDDREAELREMFELFDEDGSGCLDIDELGRLMTKLGTPIDAQILRAMVAAVDDDGDMELDCDEYVELLSAYEAVKVMDSELSVKLMFNMLDADGDGSISLTELREALNSLGNGEAFSYTEVEELLRDIDEDGDGEIDLEELGALMRTMMQ